MAQLRQNFEAFVQRDAVIIVVGPEGQAAFKNFWAKNQLPFVGLADPDHKVADLYGQQVKWLKFGRMPALMLVDKQGLVVYQHYGDSMKDIPPSAEILALLDKLNTQAGR